MQYTVAIKLEIGFDCAAENWKIPILIQKLREFFDE